MSEEEQTIISTVDGFVVLMEQFQKCTDLPREIRFAAFDAELGARKLQVALYSAVAKRGTIQG